MQSGIPSWENLLKRLATTTKDSELFELLTSNGADYLSLVGFLVSQDKDWVAKLRTAIYRDFQFYKTDIGKENRTQFVNHIEESNATLASVGNLLAIKEEGKRTYKPNPQIRSVFTLNYDHILQAYCSAKFQKSILRTTERASASRRKDKINIYHLHGMLRFDNKISLEKESSDKVILSENEYFERFANPYDIFNYTLLTHLRENSFLFIGLSMTDLNLRRLLYLSKKEIIQAYRNEGVSGSKLRQKIATRVNKHFVILKRNRNKVVEDYYTISLGNLGVNIIWINEFNEISTVLKKLEA